ncbi:hypothetical protein DW322_21070 [Rhodococcus rhodnii]|uniref:Uncharacterized protein n=2 Tax=Rhodococcus rhodnii TaxID=38312 RepID=R7WHY7_9NOCA|nr:hypothetical protein [Rhodococcus rhodnii]EOM74727.1 hypothetical protein Rrhod_3955 [Rhodococcus rhodnii LMG 5362]TXG92201.1 hypothetical protein DW322_21070 [Rhodococcus rhodnii]
MRNPLAGFPQEINLGTATVATLGPVGTDAHAEADRLFGKVLLADSFNEAMDLGLAEGVLVLVAAGFLERDDDKLVDSWVDIHFRNLDRMRLLATWESLTKPMCVASNTARGRSLKSMETIALHPATEVFARKFAPQAARNYVSAKPIAAQRANDGHTDGCIGSVDIVREMPNLKILNTWQPTMVWCLYEPYFLTNSND